MRSAADDEFAAFFGEAEPRLRRALVARYGSEQGRDAAAAALAWGYEHWDRLSPMENPTGYLYRVGCSRARRPRRTGQLFEMASTDRITFEPGLLDALAGLSPKQRVAVVLSVGFGWTLAEVAELTGSSISTVNTHRRRALERLRRDLGVEMP